MDNRLSSGAVARSLETSRTRVHRAVAAGVVTPHRTASGRLLFSPAEVDALRARLGQTPPIAGMTREETRVLAALARHPLGLRSGRAVARAARVSPTTASRVLGDLVALGLVRYAPQRVVAGRARDLGLWQVRTADPRWPDLAPRLAQVVLPVDDAPSPMPRRVPDELRHLFWNMDPRALDPTRPRDAAVIASRVIASDDAQAHAWAASHLPRAAFRRAARSRGLDPGRAALARLLAGERSRS